MAHGDASGKQANDSRSFSHPLACVGSGLFNLPAWPIDRWMWVQRAAEPPLIQTVNRLESWEPVGGAAAAAGNDSAFNWLVNNGWPRRRRRFHFWLIWSQIKDCLWEGFSAAVVQTDRVSPSPTGYRNSKVRKGIEMFFCSKDHFSHFPKWLLNLVKDWIWRLQWRWPSLFEGTPMTCIK